MKYRNLGNSGLKASEIGFGTWTLGLDWWGKKLEEDESIKMLKHAYDLGINFYEKNGLLYVKQLKMENKHYYLEKEGLWNIAMVLNLSIKFFFCFQHLNINPLIQFKMNIEKN
jgi:hypothetical protein